MFRSQHVVSQFGLVHAIEGLSASIAPDEVSRFLILWLASFLGQMCNLYCQHFQGKIVLMRQN